MGVDCPARLERNAVISVAHPEEAGIYLTLEGNKGALSQFEIHVFHHPLEIRTDFLTPIRMSAENQLNMKGVLMPQLLIRKEPQVPNSSLLEA